MRAVRLFLTASGFATYFVGIMVLSALTTGAVHSAFYPRTVASGVVQD